ncbi:hypothetical protein Tco_1166017 [Tanacetum coccineum]
MSSPDRPISNLEDVFSSNFPNYVPPASPDYVPTSPGKTYSSASNSFGIVPLTSPTLSLFPDDPYMKALQAFYTEKSPIPSPIIIPPKTQEFFLPEGLLSPMQLSPSTPSQPQALEIGETSRKSAIKRHEEQIQGIQGYLEEIPPERFEQIEKPKLGLWYPKDSPFDLVAYTNSDYAGASLDRKSKTGGCQFLGSRLILWQCKKQTMVVNSTTEAEYVAASS